MLCRCGEHNASSRHKEINLYLYRFLRKAGLPGSYEPNNLHHGFRPDFVLEGFEHNKRFIFDSVYPNLCNQYHLAIMLNDSVDNALLTDHNRKLSDFGNMIT